MSIHAAAATKTLLHHIAHHAIPYFAPSVFCTQPSLHLGRMALADLDIGIIADPLNWQFWPVARHMLTPALDLSDETWADVEIQLVDGSAHLGIIQRGGDPDDLLAAMVLRTIVSKQGPVTEVFLIAGRDYQLWTAQLSEMLAIGAREAGCVALRAYGRRGWEPILKRAGWDAPTVCFEMVI